MEKTPSSEPLERDVQQDVDFRGVYIEEVGISSLKTPLTISGVERDPAVSQQVSATVRLTVDLAEEQRGIHMSRLIEDLGATGETLSPAGVLNFLKQLRASQHASASSVHLEFDYFLPREAPVSGRIAKQAYRCCWSADLQGTAVTFRQHVEVPVTTLCPCSKEISAYGAHNQRGYVDVVLEHRFADVDDATISIGLEETIEKVESVASAPLYPILKRVDERFVTMQAYESPRFVEDLVRNVVLEFRDDARIDDWEVSVTNHESIHQHNAVARVRSATR